MKAVSQTYKNNIKELGREIQCEISYTQNGVLNTIENDNINSFNFHYESGLLKSTMKQLDLDVNVDIPINTQITARFGVKVNGQYENINIGSFVAYSSEQIKDTNSYKLVCYDKMLNAMKDYEKMQWYSLTEDTIYDSSKTYYELVDGEYWNVIGSILVNPKQEGWYEYTDIKYPITIKDYLSAICNHLEITLASDDFANYDKEISSELYLDEDGNSLGYTFRDVLDDIAEVTGSIICINDNNELEVRYVNETNETINEEYLKDVNVNFGKIVGPLNTITFKRTEDLDVFSLSQPIDLADDLKNEIVISDNPILNDNNRSQYAQPILNKIYGITYSLNDFSSTGITYFELCDKYNVSINSSTYPCLMLNDDINVASGGLEEFVFTEKTEDMPTDYNTTSKSQREDERASIKIDKKIGEVDIRGKTINLTADKIQIDSTNFSVDENGNITATGGTIAGYHITDNELYAETYARYDYTQQDIDIVRNIITQQTTPTQEQLEKYDLNNDGSITIQDLLKIVKLVRYGITTTNPLRIVMATGSDLVDTAFKLEDGNGNEFVKIGISGIEAEQFETSTGNLTITKTSGNSTATGTYAVNGKVVSVNVRLTTTGTINSGSNIFVGQMSGEMFPSPAVNTSLCGFLDDKAIIGAYGTDDVITIRNTSSSSISSGKTINIRGTFVV